MKSPKWFGALVPIVALISGRRGIEQADGFEHEQAAEKRRLVMRWWGADEAMAGSV